MYYEERNLIAAACKRSPQLSKELKDAEYIAYARREDVFVAWFGGPGFYAYDHDGHEVAFWNHYAEDGGYLDYDAAVASLTETVDNGDLRSYLQG
jgi:hypothetical protein